MRHRFVLPHWLVAFVPAIALAQDPADRIDFAKQVQPIFATHCYSCHGPEKQKAGIRFDKREGIAAADSGEPVLLAGKSGESHLIKLVAAAKDADAMPPKGKRLTTDEIAVLKKWIDQGAKWGDETAAEPVIKMQRGDHWSLQPVKRVEPPVTKAKWGNNAIDAFIAAKLEGAKLSPSKEADRAVLARRAYLMMHGLPPTPQQVRDFVNASGTTAQAWHKLIDELLASPRYGERWARHWLDVVRFAETNGFETNTPRPRAYHYRDYVIRAFNEDKPYDQFIREQLAGDAVGEDAATGFLVAGAMDEVKSPDIGLTLMQRSDELNDIVNTTSTAFLGLTVACARCHNHKFDPISQKDYFAFMGVFAGVNHGERAIRVKEQVNNAQLVAELRGRIDAARGELSKLAKLREPVNPKVNEDRFAAVKAKFVRFHAIASNSAEPCIDELEIYAQAGGTQEPKNVARGGKPTSSGDYQGNPIHQLAHINDGAIGNSHSWIASTSGNAWVQIELAEPAMIDRIVWGRDRTEFYKDRLAVRYRIEVSADEGKPVAWKTVASSDDRVPFGTDAANLAALQFSHLPPADAARAKKLAGDIQQWEQKLSSLTAAPTGYVGRFSQPGPVHRLFRGDPMAPREVVEPNALEMFEQDLKLTNQTPEQKRRVALADWIASKENPLTARVMVNRLWQHHFGAGLVDSPSDFGKMGSKPTHPQLLDYLADEFMKSGWSIKHIHRLILQSATWQQTSSPREDAIAVDADSRLLWRFPPQRIEAEAIRDSVLAVAGSLNEQMGGPGWNAFEDNSNYVRVYKPKERFTADDYRRMIYMYKVRMEQDATFGPFDCPDAGQPTAKRTKSTTAIQALSLFNSPIMLEQSKTLATRLEKEAGPKVSAQVKLAFELCFSRSPEDKEASGAESFIAGYGLPAFCRAMLNANEFVYVP